MERGLTKAIFKEELADIRDVSINTELKREERMKDFLAQIKNPYVFKCGELIVESVFSDTDRTLADCLKHFLKQ